MRRAREWGAIVSTISMRNSYTGAQLTAPELPSSWKDPEEGGENHHGTGRVLRSKTTVKPEVRLLPEEGEIWRGWGWQALGATAHEGLSCMFKGYDEIKEK